MFEKLQKPNFNNSLLHFGHCSVHEAKKGGSEIDLKVHENNILYAFEGYHAKKQLVLTSYLPSQGRKVIFEQFKHRIFRRIINRR